MKLGFDPGVGDDTVWRSTRFTLLERFIVDGSPVLLRAFVEAAESRALPEPALDFVKKAEALSASFREKIKNYVWFTEAELAAAFEAMAPSRSEELLESLKDY